MPCMTVASLEMSDEPYKIGTLQGKKEIFTKQHELSTDCDEVAKCYKDYARCYKNLRQARLQD